MTTVIRGIGRDEDANMCGQPRLSKLIDIWLGSKTFSSDMLNAYKQRLSDTPISAPGNTPSIPQQAFDGRASTNYAAAAPVPAPQAPPAVATPTNGYAYAQPPSVATPTSVSMAHQHHVGTPSAVSQAQYAPPVPVAAAIPQSFPGYPPQPPPGMQQYMQQLQAPPQAVAPPPIAAAVAAQNQATVAHNAQAAAAAAPALPALNPAQLAAVQSVVSANPNITAEQLMQILAAMGVPLPAATPQVAAAPVAVSVSQPPPPIPPQPQYDTYSSQRDRSRSPDYKRRRVTPPAKRESPVYGAYDPNAKSERSGGGEYDRRGEQGRGKGSGRDNVRKRSPPRERMASPSIRGVGHAQNPKPFGHDHTLGGGMIRGNHSSLLPCL
jgi:protein NRD1